MRKLWVLNFGLLFATSAFAEDFMDYHKNLFRNQTLCDSQLPDQVQAEQNFKEMYATLKQDKELGRKSVIEVMDYSVGSTTLKNNSTGKECAIVLHEDCYSAYCEYR